MSDEIILGYDLREMSLDPDQTWPLERRDLYLLRQDFKKPLSADTIVWPSMFDTDEKLRANQPTWVGYLNLWDNLERLRETVRQVWGATWQPSWLIAISIVSASIRGHETRWRDNFDSVLPRERADDWLFFGYDVADASLLSGLTNCGYTPQDRRAINVTEWVPHLNEFHLFNSSERAMAFKTLTDMRVKEHAPFAVYGLYLVEQRADK